MPMSAAEHFSTTGKLGILTMSQKAKKSLIYWDLFDTTIPLI